MGAQHIYGRSLWKSLIDNYMKLCPLFKHFNAVQVFCMLAQGPTRSFHLPKDQTSSRL